MYTNDITVIACCQATNPPIGWKEFLAIKANYIYLHRHLFFNAIIIIIMRHCTPSIIRGVITLCSLLGGYI